MEKINNKSYEKIMSMAEHYVTAKRDIRMSMGEKAPTKGLLTAWFMDAVDSLDIDGVYGEDFAPSVEFLNKFTMVDSLKYRKGPVGSKFGGPRIR